MPGMLELLASLQGGMPSQQVTPQSASIANLFGTKTPPMGAPAAMPAAPAMAPPSGGVRGMFGIDKPVGGSGFSRGDMMALALSQFANQQGGGQGGNMVNTMLASKMNEKQASSKRDKLVQQMRAAGYDEKDIIAVQFAPEQAIKAIYDAKAPYTLNQGDARYTAGGQLEANNPKFAYQNDQVLQETPTGVNNMGRLDPSYSDMETGRHNKVQESIGWMSAKNSAPATWVPMTAEQVAAAGLAPGTAAQINTKTGQYQVAPQGNKSGQLTEQEAKFGLYAGQGLQAAADLDALEAAGYNRAAVGEIATSAFSDEAKIYDNKITQFIDAWARAMTGAAMTKEESNRYIKQLSPQPFDTQQVRNQKAAMRKQMADQLRIAAGRGMKIADQTVAPGNAPPPTPSTPQLPLVDLNGRVIR